MEESVDKSADATAHWNGSICLLSLVGLLAWQTWLSLGLFGPDDPWRTLLDDRPVISGAHPQHLYLGYLGAQSLAGSGTICVYDTAFQIGYLKTPIFNGSRIAEIVLFLGGGTYNPAAYKVGLLVICLLVPILLLFACFGCGLSSPASLLATAMGIFLAWGPSGRLAIEAGETDVLLAALAMLAHAAMLIRFHRVPGFPAWLGVWLTAGMVWFCQPLMFPLALPLLLFFYLSVGARHASFTWHGSLFLAQAAALAVQLPWLVDWVNYWWLRSPLPASTSMLPHRTLQTLWDAPLWGGALDRGLALVVLGSALAGLVLLHYQQRLAARLLAMGAIGLLVLAFLGISWEPIGQMGTSALFLPALWFAALPAAHAWTWMFAQLAGHGARGLLTLACLLGGLGFVAYDRRDELSPFVERALVTEPLQIGLGPVRELVVQKIAEHTGTDARILWEDRPLPRQAPRWSALLPILTGRTYLGGLDPDAFIEHSWISFIDGALEGRPIAAWRDDALQEYCKRYNVGWVVAWSPAVLKRFREWEGAVPVADLVDDVPGCLFLVKYARRDYTLKGKAKMVHADWHHITLADVVPENGVVVLSMHYQAGMRASPSRVQIEREPGGDDPIGFIRLRVAGPVARVTLTWGER
jgi:hypothetical protein